MLSFACADPGWGSGLKVAKRVDHLHRVLLGVTSDA